MLLTTWLKIVRFRKAVCDEICLRSKIFPNINYIYIHTNSTLSKFVSQYSSILLPSHSSRSAYISQSWNPCLLLRTHELPSSSSCRIHGEVYSNNIYLNNIPSKAKILWTIQQFLWYLQLLLLHVLCQHYAFDLQLVCKTEKRTHKQMSENVCTCEGARKFTLLSMEAL